MNKSRVFIIDDEQDIRESLQSWLSRDYAVETFDSAESFVNALSNNKFEVNLPSCILLDFQLPGLNGVELQSKLKLMNAQFPIIFMSGNSLQSDVIDAWQGGAIDFILKPFTANQVSKRLFNFFQSTNLNAKVDDPATSSHHLLEIPISQREAQVLALLGQGYLQNQVADNLGLSLRTIKMHRAAIKNKLNLKTLAELGSYYIKNQASIEKIAKN
jgi:FixJ family two-component response regulator